MTFVQRGGVLQRIDYAHLGVEEIGAVYESLLEYVPRVTTEAAALGWLTYLAWRKTQVDDKLTPVQGDVTVAGSMSGGAIAQGEHAIVVSGVQ